MTGYGRGEAVGPQGRAVVEIKSVNHRFCDLQLRLPRLYLGLEDALRRLIQARISRGRVEVYFAIEPVSRKVTVKVDKSLAKAYYEALEDLRRFLGVNEPLRLETVLTVGQGVLSISEWPSEEIWPLVEEATNQALQALLAAREKEGQALAKNLRPRVDRLLKLSRDMQQLAPEVVEHYRTRLVEKVRLWEVEVSPERLAAEVALWAERADVTEELVRLEHHLDCLRELLETGGPVGRQLDFLCQEILRELNTLGAKAQSLALNRLVLEAKGELEKVREQGQNIE
ncbi:YicC/YloC family endoribonuclease [Desulfothermobacter acidiphilus]|uniref:YicC/YloC family endoribonuclease n=1 Tax=Desulfothermobacter acidiphilus TaxID=1938353 RepID=UPI003F8ADF63